MEPFIESRPFGEHYFRWLADDLSLHNGEDHYMLLHQLYCKPFYWVVRGDTRLIDDTLEMRAYYQSIWHSNLPEDMGVNVLEVLNCLALRMSNMIFDHNQKEWFWEFMHNLKLDKFSDRKFATESASDIVNLRLATWLTRNYSPNGRGGIFPISAISFFEGNGNAYKTDQTRLSIYEQAIMYARTNYCVCDWHKDFNQTYMDHVEEDYLWESLTV